MKVSLKGILGVKSQMSYTQQNIILSRTKENLKNNKNLNLQLNMENYVGAQCEKTVQKPMGQKLSNSMNSKNIARTSDNDDGACENKFETQNAHLVLIKNQDFSRNLIKGMKTKEVINIVSTTP